MSLPTDHPILFFDGVCNLCNGFVQFVIKRDPKAVFRFAPLQSEEGREVLENANLSTEELSTVVLYWKGEIYTHSDVPLEVAKLLGGGWQLFYIFRIIPKGIRNAIYDWVARNRYRWFGRKESCMIPTPDLKSRFL